MCFVIIVEPDENERKRLEHFFDVQKKQFHYIITGHAEEALDLLEKECADVLVSETELPYINGKEFFSMAELISPETIRIAMSNVEDTGEMITFLNTCDIFKIILKPVRSYEDFYDPLHAAFEYKLLKDKTKEMRAQAKRDLVFAEEDYCKMQELFEQNKQLYESAADTVLKLAEVNFAPENAVLFDAVSIKRYLKEIYDAYLLTIIHGDGSYLTTQNILMNELQKEPQKRTFSLKLQNNCEVLPKRMNQIAFLLLVIGKCCASILNGYRMKAVIENGSERFQIVRFVCDYSHNFDENGNFLFLEPREDFRRDKIELTKRIIDSIVYKSMFCEKENQYILNCAIEKKSIT